MARQQLSVQSVHASLVERRQIIMDSLPKSLQVDRFMAAAQIYLQRNPGLLSCLPETLIDAFLRCANDGLVPDGRQAAIVPFFDKQIKGMAAQYLPMVSGIIMRLRQLGDVYSIEANAVYESDHFEWVSGDHPKCDYRPSLEMDEAARGRVRAAYVLFRDKSERIIGRTMISHADIERMRRQSRAANSPAWRDWYDQMAIKCAIRRGSKLLPTLSIEGRRLVERDDDYTLLEGKAQLIRENPAANPLIDPSLDAFDDDGNLIEAQSLEAETVAAEPATDDDAGDGWPLAEDAAEPVVPRLSERLDAALAACRSQSACDVALAGLRGEIEVASEAEKESCRAVWQQHMQRLKRAKSTDKSKAKAATGAH
ncbi:MAG: recombinase RecT [Bacteroidota bacterium]